MGSCFRALCVLCAALLIGGCGPGIPLPPGPYSPGPSFFHHEHDEDEAVIAAAEAPAVRLPPTGRFRITITGQVVADEGFESFALDGTLIIETTYTGDATEMTTSVTLSTDAGTYSTFSPAGAVLLESLDGNEEVLALTYTGLDIILTAPVGDGLLSPGRFKTAELHTSGFDVMTVLIRITVSGDAVTGTIDLSSQLVPLAVLPSVAEYSAQFTGQRAGG